MKTFNNLLLLLTIPLLITTEKISSCTEENTIALTFDDGPFKYTEELINLLNENNIKATFFINVENYWKDLPTNKNKQKIIKKAYNSGHQIASHTWAHHIPSDIEKFDEVMNKTDSWIENIIGNKPAYFRAPKGECNEKCRNYLEEKNYKLIQWDTDTNDWNNSNGVDYRVKKVKNFLTESWDYKRSNYLILMHDVYEYTVREIVPWIIKHKPLGYKFVTVAECLGDKYSMYQLKNKKDFQTISETNDINININEPISNYDFNNLKEPKNNNNNNTNNTFINIDKSNSNLTSNNNIDNFSDNTVINDNNQGNLVYESSALLSYKYNNVLLFIIAITFLKIIYICNYIH